MSNRIITTSPTPPTPPPPIPSNPPPIPASSSIENAAEDGGGGGGGTDSAFGSEETSNCPLGGTFHPLPLLDDCCTVAASTAGSSVHGGTLNSRKGILSISHHNHHENDNNKGNTGSRISATATAQQRLHYDANNPNPSSSSSQSQSPLKFTPFTRRQKDQWLRHGDGRRGFIRLFHPSTNLKSSILIPVNRETTVAEISAKLGLLSQPSGTISSFSSATGIHVQFAGEKIQRLQPTQSPLLLQNEFIMGLGVGDVGFISELGDSLSLGYLIRFYAGKPIMDATLDASANRTVSAFCHVRRGKVFSAGWTRRLCILNATKLIMFHGTEEMGEPEVLSIGRAKVEEVHLKSRGRCIKITGAPDSSSSASSSGGGTISKNSFGSIGSSIGGIGGKSLVRRTATTRNSTTGTISGSSGLSSIGSSGSSSNSSSTTTYLSFDSMADLNTWLARCVRAAAKIPPISDLSNLHLETLPDQVFCVSSERLLTTLNLRKNSLRMRNSHTKNAPGKFLDDLNRLQSLRTLNLSDNGLREFPTVLTTIPALTELHIASNKLTNLPSDIQKLQQFRFITEPFLHSRGSYGLLTLSVLNLQNNELSWLPTEMTECTKLTVLDLSFNRFTSIPPLLYRFPRLSKWELSGNSILFFGSHQLLASADSVKSVDLSLNPLSQPLALPNSTLCSITWLCLDNCPVIPQLDLTSLASLQELHCNRCEIDDILLNGTSLRDLYISRNNIVEVTVIPSPQMLKTLNVSHNRLQRLPDWLSEVNGIEQIIAGNNKINQFPPRLLTSAVSNLRRIEMNQNDLRQLPANIDNCSVEVLDLHHNKIAALPPEFLASMHKLRVLNLAQNLLKALPPLNPFTDLNKVTHLTLAANELTDLAVVNVVAGYRRLRQLDVSYNNLTDISGLMKLDSLEDLNVSGNRLAFLPDTLSAALPKLATLRAHSNAIRTLPNFSAAHYLKVLDVGSNQLEEVEPNFLLAPQMKHLDLSCNPGLRLDSSVFNKYRSERVVSMIEIDQENKQKKAVSIFNNKANDENTTNSYRTKMMNQKHDETEQHNARSNHRQNYNQTTMPTMNENCSVDNKPPTTIIWQSGFSETSGERNKLCISQVRAGTLDLRRGGVVYNKCINDGVEDNNHGRMTTIMDGLFGIIDGGKNNHIPSQLQADLPALAKMVYANAKDPKETAKLMKEIVIRSHIVLENVGQTMGASMALAHFSHHLHPSTRSADSSTIGPIAAKLCVANLGHTEIVLCRRGRALLLTKNHAVDRLKPNDAEYQRIRDSAGILTKNGTINGVSHCSRQVGNGFLHPTVIPCPRVISLDLDPASDEYVLMASKGLWSVMSHQEAVKRIRYISSPIAAAKHLQDMARSYGYDQNLSIIVIRLFLNDDHSISDESVACGRNSNAAHPSSDSPAARNLRRIPPNGNNVGAQQQVDCSSDDNVPGSISNSRTSNFPSPAPLTRLGLAQSAINIIDDDTVSDDEVRSEPVCDEDVLSKPNYYFEYKRKLKEMMLDGDASSTTTSSDLESDVTSVYSQTNMHQLDEPEGFGDQHSQAIIDENDVISDDRQGRHHRRRYSDEQIVEETVSFTPVPPPVPPPPAPPLPEEIIMRSMVVNPSFHQHNFKHNNNNQNNNRRANHESAERITTDKRSSSSGSFNQSPSSPSSSNHKHHNHINNDNEQHRRAIDHFRRPQNTSAAVLPPNQHQRTSESPNPQTTAIQGSSTQHSWPNQSHISLSSTAAVGDTYTQQQKMLTGSSFSNNNNNSRINNNNNNNHTKNNNKSADASNYSTSSNHSVSQRSHSAYSTAERKQLQVELTPTLIKNEATKYRQGEHVEDLCDSRIRFLAARQEIMEKLNIGKSPDGSEESEGNERAGGAHPTHPEPLPEPHYDTIADDPVLTTIVDDITNV